MGCGETMASAIEESDNNNNLQPEGKYSLRPRTTKDTEEQEERAPRKKRRSVKNQPLSKYRRKTANARERGRMKEINDAFEALRRVIPQMSSESDSQGEKLTKISTLRLAMKYISALDMLLQEPDFESDGESMLSEYSCFTPTDLHLQSFNPVCTDSSSPSLTADLAATSTQHTHTHTHTLTASLFTNPPLASLQPLDTADSLSKSSYLYEDMQFLDFS